MLLHPHPPTPQDRYPEGTPRRVGTLSRLRQLRKHNGRGCMCRYGRQDPGPHVPPGWQTMDGWTDRQGCSASLSTPVDWSNAALPPASPSHRNEPRGGRVRAGEPFDLPERWLPDGETENRSNIRNIRLKSSSSCSAFPCNSVLEERFIIATIRGKLLRERGYLGDVKGRQGCNLRLVSLSQKDSFIPGKDENTYGTDLWKISTH